MSKFVSCLEASDPFLAMNMELSMTMESFQVPVTEDLKAVKNFIVEKAKKLWDWICEWADKIKDKISEFLEKMPAFKEREIEDLILDPDKLDAIDDMADKIEKLADVNVVMGALVNPDRLRTMLNSLDEAVEHMEELRAKKRAKKKGSYVQAKKWCLQLQAKCFMLKQRTRVAILKWKALETCQDQILTLTFNKQAAAMTLLVGILNHDISVLRSVALRPEKETESVKKQNRPSYKALPAGSGA